MKSLSAVGLLWCIHILSTSAIAGITVEGDLSRRADLGFSVSASDNRLAIKELEEGSPGARTSLIAGDIIVSVNGKTYAHNFEGRDLLRRLNGGETVSIVVQRAGSELQFEFVPEETPFVDTENAHTIYDVVETKDGSRLRTALSHRQDVKGPMPLVVLIQWVSCGIVTDDLQPELKTVMDALPVAILRVERSSDGDSEGPACHELDYNTEIRHYTAAILDIVGNRIVDPSRVYLYGSSLGSTIAPLVAQELKRDKLQVAGLMVQGGGGLTHVERMINFDRINLERRNDREFRSIHEEMMPRILFQTEYLIKRRHPDEIARDGDAMARVRNDILGLGKFNHYGRPFAWHQQAASHDFLEAWLDVAAPTLVVFAEFDQFEMSYGHRVIVDVLNREHPGIADYVELPNINHFNDFHTDVDQAYFRADGIPAIDLFASEMVKWLRKGLAH